MSNQIGVEKMAKRVVIAVGGNAILQPHQAPTFEAQL